MTIVPLTSADSKDVAYAALEQYLLTEGNDLDSYSRLLEDVEADIKERYDEELISYERSRQELRLVHAAWLALEKTRRETEPVSSWAETKATKTGPVCGHCAYGRGRDRVTVRHANADQVRRCADIQSVVAAETAAELAAERRLERAYEERGAGLEPDERDMLPW